MTLRLGATVLVVGALLADGAGQHPLGYYALVAAVPVAAIGALGALGAILDGSAAEPLDRGIAWLSALALPLLLLSTAVRAPASEGPPPALGISALVACLGVLALQAVLGSAALLAGRAAPDEPARRAATPRRPAPARSAVARR